jgi:hypothetical protein
MPRDRRFIPLKYMFRHRGGIRKAGGTVWPRPHWASRYVATLYRREKRENWLARRDFSRRSDKRFAEGRKNTYPDCPQNFWGWPYS